jgi:acetolactate synthase-1/2/3 large subunit
LPIKIVILNNQGYLSIKNTQSKFYEGRVYGTNPETGVWFPEFLDIADTFEIPYDWASKKIDLKLFKKLLNKKTPVLINCFCTQDQQILPAQSFKDGKQAPLHDMIPFLSDEELQQEMVVKL